MKNKSVVYLLNIVSASHPVSSSDSIDVTIGNSYNITSWDTIGFMSSFSRGQLQCHHLMGHHWFYVEFQPWSATVSSPYGPHHLFYVEFQPWSATMSSPHGTPLVLCRVSAVVSYNVITLWPTPLVLCRVSAVVSYNVITSWDTVGFMSSFSRGQLQCHHRGYHWFLCCVSAKFSYNIFIRLGFVLCFSQVQL